MPKKNRIQAQIDMVQKKIVPSFKSPRYKKEKLDVENGPKPINGALAKWQAVTNPFDVVSKWKDYACSRRSFDKSVKKRQSYRIGPAPREEHKRKTTHEALNSTHQGIDSDLYNDSSDEEAASEVKKPRINKLTTTANNRALIIYFSKLASTPNSEDVDLNFVEGLIANGADINVTDKHGQTIFHEVARAWHVDVAKFLVEKKASINKTDKFGRSPLHVAAAVNYPEMVEFLVQNGGRICFTM